MEDNEIVLGGVHLADLIECFDLKHADAISIRLLNFDIIDHGIETHYLGYYALGIHNPVTTTPLSTVGLKPQRELQELTLSTIALMIKLTTFIIIPRELSLDWAERLMTRRRKCVQETLIETKRLRWSLNMITNFQTDLLENFSNIYQFQKKNFPRHQKCLRSR